AHFITRTFGNGIRQQMHGRREPIFLERQDSRLLVFPLALKDISEPEWITQALSKRIFGNGISQQMCGLQKPTLAEQQDTVPLGFLLVLKDILEPEMMAPIKKISGNGASSMS